MLDKYFLLHLQYNKYIVRVYNIYKEGLVVVLV